MLKHQTRTKKYRGVHYIIDSDDRPRRYRPWLGDAFSFFYDRMMRKSIFPKKFQADMNKHFQVLTKELDDVHGQRVLELATGSGSVTAFLSKDNHYVGTDISAGLLKQAARRLRHAGFADATLYLANAEDLPFEDASFTHCLCVLSLNFFADLESVIQEVKRVLTANGVFVCVTPIPERQLTDSVIRGTLYSEETLQSTFHRHGFVFMPIACNNGALLYFKAFKRNNG